MPERNQKLNKMFYSLLDRGKNPWELMSPEQLELAGAYLPSVYQANPGHTTGGVKTATGPAGAGNGKGGFFKKGGFFDGFTGKFSNLANPEFDYSWTTVKDANGNIVKNAGVQGWGKNLGGMYNIGNAVLQGAKAGKSLKDTADIRSSSDDLVTDILASAANSPTIGYDLNADQKRLLRELQRGTYDNSANLGDVDLLGALGGGLTGVIGGLPGGLPGAIIGGIGGVANSVLGDMQNDASRDASELEALYQAVLESEQYHNEKRKQRAYSALY